MLADLRQWRSNFQVLTDQTGKPVAAEKDLLDGNLDEFGRQKLRVVHALTSATESVGRLVKLRLKAGSNGSQSLHLIQLKSENACALQIVGTEWSALSIMLRRASDARPPAWSAELINIREQQLRLLSEEIALQVARNSNVQDPAQRSEVTRNILRSERERRRRERQRKDDQELRPNRHDINSGSGLSTADNLDRKHGSGALPDIELAGGFRVVSVSDDTVNVGGAASTEDGVKVQEFVLASKQRTADEDAVLTDIRRGVNELAEIAHDMHRIMDVGTALTTELDVKLDLAKDKTAAAAQRAREIIEEENGGCTKCIPLTICFIILFALIMYMISAIH
jgi:hypothetical protein